MRSTYKCFFINQCYYKYRFMNCVICNHKFISDLTWLDFAKQKSPGLFPQEKHHSCLQPFIFIDLAYRYLQEGQNFFPLGIKIKRYFHVAIDVGIIGWWVVSWGDPSERTDRSWVDGRGVGSGIRKVAARVDNGSLYPYTRHTHDWVLGCARSFDVSR